MGMAEGGVTLGQLPLGEGRVTVLGSLLPVPTEEYDHPYGLSSYGVTYSGYEVLRNLMDWENPNRAAHGRPDRPKPPKGPKVRAAAVGGVQRLPATGGGAPLAPAAAALLAALGARVALGWRRHQA